MKSLLAAMLACSLPLLGASSRIQPDWFTGSTLSPVFWSTSLLRSGTAAQNGKQLTISVPAAANHDNTTGWSQVTQTISDGDFAIIVKMDAKPPNQAGSTYYASGIAFLQDTSNGVYCEYDWNGFNGAYEFNCTQAVGGTQTNMIASRGSGGDPGPYYLEVIRSGSNWTMKWSLDGASWTTLWTFTQAFTISQLGLFTNNYNSTPGNAQAYTGAFDYVCNAVNDRCISRNIPRMFWFPSMGASGGGAPTPATSACLPARITVTGTNGSGDAAALQSALNGGGNIAAAGTFAIGATQLTIPANTCLSAASGATINYTGTSYAAVMNGSAPNVTINGITWNGGGILSNRNGYTLQTNLTITNNVIQNLTASGQYGVYLDAIQDGLTVQGNTFLNIAPGGWASVPFSGGNPGNPCPGSGCGDYNGGEALHVEGGMNNSTISGNLFRQIANNGISAVDDACLDASASAPANCSNDSIQYNTFDQVLRIGVEWQGVAGSCWSGTCNFSKIATVTQNRYLKGNNCFNITKSYYQTWCYSNVPGNNTWYINNSAIWNPGSAGSTGASGFEVSNQPGTLLVQGNVVAIGSAATVYFSNGFAVATQSTGNTAVLQNNLQCGKNIPLYSTEPGGTGGTITVQYNNYTTASCPNAANPQTSNVSPAWTSANNQSFPSGGNGTWTLYATGNLPIRYVQFYIDSSTTPVVMQEIGDLNTNFANDGRWNYHATFNTSSYHGAHTISATATDVSGAVSTITQSFTGPP